MGYRGHTVNKIVVVAMGKGGEFWNNSWRIRGRHATLQKAPHRLEQIANRQFCTGHGSAEPVVSAFVGLLEVFQSTAAADADGNDADYRPLGGSVWIYFYGVVWDRIFALLLDRAAIPYFVGNQFLFWVCRGVRF